MIGAAVGVCVGFAVGVIVTCVVACLVAVGNDNEYLDYPTESKKGERDE